MQKTIDDFINSEYREYAEYVAFKRALPSLIDSFKSARRKIFYYMLKNKNKDFIRVSSIAGGIAENCHYKHAEVSAQNTVINMMRDFPSSNNIPFFLSKGGVGSKIMPKAASAARYIQAKYNPMMDYIYLDNDLTIPDIDIENPEPTFYYPIIPMFLVNGISGIGIGFACNILPRKPIDIINAIRNYLFGQQIENIIPYYNNCKYVIKQTGDKSYQISGVIDYKKSAIVETIPHLNRDTIISKLIDLKAEGQIKSFSDESKEDWFIKIKNNGCDLFDKLPLSTSITENYTLLDHQNKIKAFKDIQSMISEFVDYRLTVYTKRKQKRAEELLNNIEKNQLMIKLSKYIKSLNKVDSQSIIEKFSGEYDVAQIKETLNKPLSTFFKANVDKLNNEIDDFKKQIKYYNNVSEKELYIKDLKELENRL